jgi:hypothetical protein
MNPASDKERMSLGLNLYDVPGKGMTESVYVLDFRIMDALPGHLQILINHQTHIRH